MGSGPAAWMRVTAALPLGSWRRNRTSSVEQFVSSCQPRCNMSLAVAAPHQGIQPGGEPVDGRGSWCGLA